MSREPEEIRQDIERTRGNLSDDVDAIADKVSPSSIAHRQGQKIKGTVRRAKDAVMGGVESVGEDASETMHHAPDAVASQTRGNPLAAGLIAFGAGLLASSLIPGSDKEREMVHTLKEKAEPVTSELADAAKSIAQDMKEPAAEAVDAIKSSAQESVQTVKSEAREEASHLQDQAGEAASNVKGSDGQAGPGALQGDPAHRADGL